MRLILALALLALAHASFAQTKTVRLYGIGRVSCASWLQNSQSEAEGSNWILGFWTAANFYGDVDRDIGGSTDPQGILAAIKLRCQADPAEMLVNATASLFLQFKNDGR